MMRGPEPATRAPVPQEALCSAPHVPRCHSWGDDCGSRFRLETERLLEELGHIQTRNYDFLEDRHVVWIRLRGALLQCLNDGLLHVPAGIPSHGQQSADVVVSGKAEGREGREWQGCMGGCTEPLTSSLTQATQAPYYPLWLS